MKNLSLRHIVGLGGQKQRSHLAVLLLPIAWACACTTLNSEPSLSQDDAFSLASFDSTNEQTNTVLRSFDQPVATAVESSWLQKDFYLPVRMTKAMSTNVERARKTLSEESPKHAASLRVLATEALLEGNPQMALGFLKISDGSGAGNSVHSEALLLKGIAYGLMGDVQRSRKFLTESAQMSQGSGAAHANLGLLAYKHGNNLEAHEFFKSAITVEPKLAAFHHMAAEVAYASGKHSLALGYYSKLISLRRSDLLAHYNMGVVYLYGLKDYSNARNKFRFVIEHPRASEEMRAKADGAFASVRREEESDYGLASAEAR